MVKGVIFDVDGVLLNSMPVWENLGELYLQKFGIQAEKDLSEILYEMSLKEAAEYLISHYGLKQTVEEVILKEFLRLQRSEVERISRICISQRHFNWIQIRGRPGSLRMHGMQSERQRVRDLRRSQSMIRRTIKIWDKSGIMRIFICRIC